MIQSACRQENISILACFVGQIPISLLYTALFVNPWMTRDNLPGPLLSVIIWFIVYFMWIAAHLARKLRQRKARILLKKNRCVPAFEIFGNEGRLLLTDAIAAGSGALLFAIWELSSQAVWMAAGAIAAAFILMVFSLLPRMRKKWMPGFLRSVGIVPVVMVVFSLLFLPGVRNYRFMQSGAKYESFNDSEEEKRAVDYSRRDYGKELRYVGTVKAELKKAGYLDRYLRQKGLSLETSARLALDTRREYYLTESGKEVIGVDGRDVVIYFLNQDDERRFRADDPKLLAAVERRD